MEKPCITLHRIDTLDALRDTESIINLLDEQGTRGNIDSLNWASEFPCRPMATFAAAYTGKNLYVDFLVRSNYLRAENVADQSPVSEDSCVEVFLRPQPDGDYWNFEFNCIGAINASHRKVRPEPVRLTAAELARVKRYPSCGTRPFKEVEGLFTWNLLVVIPLELMNMENPAPGTVIEGNFYKCASASVAPHYMSWAPIDTSKPDFHRPEFFGKIVLE